MTGTSKFSELLRQLGFMQCGTKGVPLDPGLYRLDSELGNVAGDEDIRIDMITMGRDDTAIRMKKAPYVNVTFIEDETGCGGLTSHTKTSHTTLLFLL